MSGAMAPYVVRQGDYLAKIAFVHGFDADEVWNDPKNEGLKRLRRDHRLLAPGDLVYLPVKKKEGLPLQKGTTNRYVAKVPKVEVVVVFQDDDKPLADEPYVIEGLGAPQEGTTDSSGKIAIDVPLLAREGRVVFTKRNIAFPLLVGDMDPIDEATGVRKRLQHLGHMPPPGDPSETDQDELDRASIAAFQEARGLPVTGAADEATKAELVKVHGA